MSWKGFGCHSFCAGENHAVFNCYYDSGLSTRLKILWAALTRPGIVGFVYQNACASSPKLEHCIENEMADYGKRVSANDSRTR